MTGTISGTNVTSVTRAQDGTTAAAHNSATVELYQINNVPLTEINKTHVISNIGIDSYVIATTTQSDTASTSGGLVCCCNRKCNDGWYANSCSNN